MAPEVAQSSWINGEARGRGYSCPNKQAGEKFWGYLMMSCDRLRYLFNVSTLETVPSSLSSTQKEKVEQ